ncbi:hypothetical protein ACWIGI_10035 [Nocardia sp. NPDC055321]
MSLQDLSEAAVLAALTEFDAVGRDEFLAKYKFGRARSYFIVFEGRRYDSKAIAGAAHGYLPGRDALLPADFSGGEATVATTLRGLGFEMHTGRVEHPSDEIGGLRSADSSPASPRLPPWAWHELVLACDLTARHGWHELDVNHKEVVALSNILRRLDIHPGAADNARFRSRGSVRRKMMNIAHCHPNSTRKDSNHGALDLEVVNAFISDPDRMHAFARQLRHDLLSAPDSEPDHDTDIGDNSAPTPDIDLPQFRPSSEDVLISAIRAHFRVTSRDQRRLATDFGAAATARRLRPEKDSATGDLVLSRGSRRWIVATRVVANGNATAAVQAAIGSLTYTRHFLYRDENIDVVALFTEPIGAVYVDFLETLGIRSIWRAGDGWDGSVSAVRDQLVGPGTHGSSAY